MGSIQNDLDPDTSYVNEEDLTEWEKKLSQLEQGE